MEKKEFLEKLNNKIELSKGKLDAFELKRIMLPIIQQDFIDSVAEIFEKDKKIMLQSRMFEIITKNGVEHYIIINDRKIKLNYDSEMYLCIENAFLDLRVQIVQELKEMLGENVFSELKNDKLFFYCYY